MKDTLIKSLLVMFLTIPLMIMNSSASSVERSYAHPGQANNQLNEVSVTIDSVAVTIRTPFLPMRVLSDHPFTTSEPGSINQIATASSPRPYRSLSIMAVPFGTQPGTEPVPIAKSGEVTAYLNA